MHCAYMLIGVWDMAKPLSLIPPPTHPPPQKKKKEKRKRKKRKNEVSGGKKVKKMTVCMNLSLMLVDIIHLIP